MENNEIQTLQGISFLQKHTVWFRKARIELLFKEHCLALSPSFEQVYCSSIYHPEFHYRQVKPHVLFFPHNVYLMTTES